MTYMEGMVYKEVDKDVNKEADKEVNKEVDEYEAYAVNKVDKEVNKVRLMRSTMSWMMV